MHETGIARSLIAAVSSAVEGRDVKVERINVAVGTLSGVLPAALNFAFEMYSRGTALEGAQLVLRDYPVEAKCLSCGGKYSPQGLPYRCPLCDSTAFEVLHGEEVFAESIECEE